MVGERERERERRRERKREKVRVTRLLVGERGERER